MEHLIDVTYFLSDRQDATISFAEKRPKEVATAVARLPGVVAAEPFREVPVRIRSANVERRIVITGRVPDADLSRIIDVDLRPVSCRRMGSRSPPGWPASSAYRSGDFVEVDLLDGQRRTVSLPVAALVEDYFGIRGMMNLTALGRLMREAPSVSGVHVAFDENSRGSLYEAIKRLPTVSALAFRAPRWPAFVKPSPCSSPRWPASTRLLPR